jgi:membrane protein DedA with SNARE-associated domain
MEEIPAPATEGGVGDTVPTAGVEPSVPVLERRALVGLLLLLIAVDRAAAAGAPWLATHHPLLLAAVDPTDKAVILALKVSLIALFPLAVIRRLLGQGLYFLIGRRLGPEAKSWLHTHGAGGVLARVERALGRWSYPIVFLAPRDVVCLLAGDMGMGWAPFLIIAGLRDCAAVLLLRELSLAFARQVDDVLGFLNAYALPATLVAVGLVALQVLAQRRRRARARRS